MVYAGGGSPSGLDRPLLDPTQLPHLGKDFPKSGRYYRRGMSRALFSVIGLAVSLGCGSAGQSLPSEATAPEAMYRPVANVKQTMDWILDPAADVIWDSAGFIITAEGETDLSPTTDEGWAQVRNSAAVVAETGNLLMMPDRVLGSGWVAYAQALTAAGEVAMAAAEAQDPDALFDAGGQIYQVCRTCHEQFMVPREEARSAR